jgi:hypothetical protein
MRGLLGLLLAGLTIGACGDDYQLRYTCDQVDGGMCLTAQGCPALPLGTENTCGDLPGFFGHEPITVDVARPEGCGAFLPYENPFYPGSPQTCFCSKDFSSTVSWRCPG